MTIYGLDSASRFLIIACTYAEGMCKATLSFTVNNEVLHATGSQSSQRCRLAPLSATAKQAVATAAKWWERDADRWVSPHTAEEFQNSLAQGPGEELVVVGTDVLPLLELSHELTSRSEVGCLFPLIYYLARLVIWLGTASVHV
jgi:hypothetical protein